MTTDSARAAPRLLALSAALLMTFSACTDASGRADLDDGLYAEMQTSRGTITLQLEFERTPLTVANFVGLAEGNIAFSNRDADRFYDGLTFHRVIDDFMVQGGDPNGDGSGGPGYTFSDEIDPELVHDAPGILSMANAGPNTNGSQFFITHVPTPWLNGNHTVFGHVVTGQDVVDSIQQGDTIDKVTILRIGSAAKAFVVDQERFDALVVEASGRGVRQAAQAREDAEAHIAQTWPGAQSSDSGLQWVVDQAGDGGGKPQRGDTATVHYTGKLLDGTVFDSSRSRGAPADLQVGRLIPGFEEALLDMTAGEQRTVIIPPELGYGSRGVPGAIPPNSFLVFELELISF